MPGEPIPSFKNPPVVEVVWSVQFQPLGWLTAALTGIFWHSLREEYPICVEQPPIETQIEPGGLFEPRGPTLHLSLKPPLPRQLFISASRTELVQLQANRFCVNWRKIHDTDQYPRYEGMETQFLRRWSAFLDFVAANSEEPIQVNQCEMTYLNHIYEGEGWSETSDFGKVFPPVSWRGGGVLLKEPASVNCQLVFDLRGDAGRLHAACQHAREIKQPKRRIMQLNLVARGRPDGSETGQLVAWFSEARRWVVQGFADLTSPEMQKTQWRRER